MKAAALSLCTALLITAVVRHLAPEGLTRELVQVVSGLFVLVTLAGALRGLSGVWGQLSWEELATGTGLSDTVRRQSMGAAEGALYDYVCGLLQAADIPYREVHIFLQTGDNGNTDDIVLDRIRVTAAYASQRERAQSLLCGLFPGVTIEVDEPDE